MINHRYTYIVYNIYISPFLVRVEFDKTANRTQIIKLFNAYKNDRRCLITKILLIKYINGIPWYNDITPHKNAHTIYLLIRMMEGRVKVGIESTHILDNESLGYSTVLEIHTLNEVNPLPTEISDEDFRDNLLRELISMM